MYNRSEKFVFEGRNKTVREQVLKRLKQTMASDPRSLQEFCSDPHAVAGICTEEPWVESLPPGPSPEAA